MCAYDVHNYFFYNIYCQDWETYGVDNVNVLECVCTTAKNLFGLLSGLCLVFDM